MSHWYFASLLRRRNIRSNRLVAAAPQTMRLMVLVILHASSLRSKSEVAATNLCMYCMPLHVCIDYWWHINIRCEQFAVCGHGFKTGTILAGYHMFRGHPSIVGIWYNLVSHRRKNMAPIMRQVIRDHQYLKTLKTKLCYMYTVFSRATLYQHITFKVPRYIWYFG